MPHGFAMPLNSPGTHSPESSFIFSLRKPIVMTCSAQHLRALQEASENPAECPSFSHSPSGLSSSCGSKRWSPQSFVQPPTRQPLPPKATVASLPEKPSASLPKSLGATTAYGPTVPPCKPKQEILRIQKLSMSYLASVFRPSCWVFAPKMKPLMLSPNMVAKTAPTPLKHLMSAISSICIAEECWGSLPLNIGPTHPWLKEAAGNATEWLCPNFRNTLAETLCAKTSRRKKHSLQDSIKEAKPMLCLKHWSILKLSEPNSNFHFLIYRTAAHPR